MHQILSVETMRASDAATIAGGVPSLELMRRAGLGIFQSYKWHGKIAIVAGSGNNAGDGYALALNLWDAGFDCYIILCTGKFSNDGAYYYRQCEEKGIPVTRDLDFSHTDILVDCLLGTGFHGTLRPNLAEVVEKINQSNCYIISADINSGMYGDTGEGICVHADQTVSIGFLKFGHCIGLRQGLIHELYNCDIGIACAGSYFPLYDAEETPVFDPEIHILPENFSSVMQSAGITEGTPPEQLRTYLQPVRAHMHFQSIF